MLASSGRFVVSYAGDSGETQRHLACVFGALLDFVVGDFNDDFGDNYYAVSAFGLRQVL